MEKEILKIKNITFELDDNCRITNCSDVLFEKRISDYIRNFDEDLYYINKENNDVYKFNFNERGEVVAQVYNAKEMDDRHWRIIHMIATEFGDDSYIIKG